jgi:oligopeptide/dipeptide ABC transporter ATP-binding protein
VLVADDVSVAYGRSRAVTGASLSVGRGEALGLVGESGSGKTSFIRAALGLLDRGATVQGALRFDDRRFDLAEPEAVGSLLGHTIGFIPQGAMSSLNPVMRIGDQIAESLVYHGGRSWRAARAEAGDHLELVGIDGRRHRAYPHEFSGGMRQRVAIAMTLAAGPELVVADEPTIGLDAAVQSEILGLLRQLRHDTGVSLVIVSHDIDAVRSVCDRVAVMYAGRVAEHGPLEQVLDSPRHRYTEALLASLPGGDGQRWRAIPGSAPDPANLPAGCGFAARCAVATSLCHSSVPELGAAAHSAACHHPAEAGDGPATGASHPDAAQPSPRSTTTTDCAPAGVATVPRTMVTCRDLGVRYGAVVALDGVTMEIADGEIIGLVGPSGSGKSTLARTLVGLTVPTSGTIEVDGVDVAELRGRRLRAFRRRQVGLVQQDPYDSLHPSMTIEAIVAEPIRRERHAVRRGRVVEALGNAGIEATPEILSCRPGQLSGGQRQRVALARALVTRPSVLVADEPTSMLDVSVRAGITERLRHLRDQGGLTVLFVTHDLHEAAQLCDRIVELDGGRLVDVRPAQRPGQHITI